MRRTDDVVNLFRIDEVLEHVLGVHQRGRSVGERHVLAQVELHVSAGEKIHVDPAFLGLASGSQLDAQVARAVILLGHSASLLMTPGNLCFCSDVAQRLPQPARET